MQKIQAVGRGVSARLLLPLLIVLFSASGWSETKIRVMTGNITSGNDQSYDEGDGIRIFKGLKPDVALVQEFRFGDNSSRALREFVDIAFGKEFSVYREPANSDGAIPNGIVSRYKILDSGVLTDPTISNRGFAWARLDVPGKTKLWVFSVHLSHSSAGRRNRGAETIIDFIAKKISPDDFVVLGGDLNTTNRKEQTISTLKQYLTDEHVPADQGGKTGTNTNRSKPYDLLLPNKALNQHHVCVDVIAEGQILKFPHGLVFDSRNFRPLNAVAPIRQGDSDSVNMQHMAVIKDFIIP